MMDIYNKYSDEIFSFLKKNKIQYKSEYFDYEICNGITIYLNTDIYHYLIDNYLKSKLYVDFHQILYINNVNNTSYNIVTIYFKNTLDLRNIKINNIVTKLKKTS